MKTIQYPYPVHNVALPNGCNIAYVDEGQGDNTILFIHGLALYSQAWKKNIDQLKQHYRCIAIDLPGNGLSSKGNLPYGIAFFAESVYQFIQTLGLKRLTIVGHSMGGQVSMKLLTVAPHSADKLILCASAGFEVFSHFQRSIYKNTITMLDVFSTEENSIRQAINMSVFNKLPYVSEMAEQLVDIMQSQPRNQYRRMIEACIDGMLDEPVFNDLHNIQQPVLVIYGERDALIPNRLIHPVTTRHIAEEGVKHLPNAQLVMIPKAGHFVHIEKAAEVNALIDTFIQAK